MAKKGGGGRKIGRNKRRPTHAGRLVRAARNAEKRAGAVKRRAEARIKRADRRKAKGRHVERGSARKARRAHLQRLVA